MFAKNLKLFVIRFGMILALLSGILGAVSVKPALAYSTIVVNTTADEDNTGTSCSLREAIIAANTNAAYGGCTAGSGTDTITVPAGTYTLTFGSQLPAVTTAIVINGAGAGYTIIQANAAPNTATYRIFGVGGAGDLTLDGLTVQNGYCNGSCVADAGSSDGGGILNMGGTLTVTNSTFSGNSATADGGGILNDGGTLTVTNSTFSGNSATHYGGGIANNGGMLTVTSSTFSGNSATKGGGIITSTVSGTCGSASTATIANSTFIGNSATSGGGIYNWLGVITLLFNTITANTSGGGVRSYNDSVTCTKVVSNIIAGNTGYDVSADETTQRFSSLGYNLIGVAGSGVDFAQEFNQSNDQVNVADPILGVLADNGGPTKTVTLLPGSPAIDAGDDTACVAAPINNKDQRGMTRPQGSHCDIGAYEYEPEPTTLYVKWNASGAKNGTSWTDAYTDLQSALSAASSGDEIWVAAGTYKPTSGVDRTASFNLKSGVAIYGGFIGTEVSLVQRDQCVCYTALSGDIGATGDNNDNSYHVVVGSGTDNTTLLDHFTITNGNANGTSSFAYGGGLYIDKGSLQLNDVTFTSNLATLGGGMYVTYSATSVDTTNIELALTDVAFTGNTSTSDGGGLDVYFMPSSPVSSTKKLSLSLSDVTFKNNTSGRTGGGMSNNGAEITLTNVTFDGNTASGGGGLSNNPLTLWPSTLIDVTFNNNSAAQSGGGMLVGSSGSAITSLKNVTFSNNSTDATGGGIENDGTGSLNLTNVTFSGNTASLNGGGISNGAMLGASSNSTITLTNATFNANVANSYVANSYGGAIYNEYGNVYVRNGILYGDTGGEIYGTATVTNSIVQGGYSGIGNLNLDPQLGPLQDNGGPTQTMLMDATSPAIDAGNDAICPSADQRGIPRIQDNHCDIGAIEYRYVIHHVKWDANGSNDGSSWTNAYTDLQSALSASLYGDEVWVAAGTYYPTSGTDRTISFDFQNGVEMYGGFSGHETSRSQRDFKNNITVLSGDIGALEDNNDNSYHVVFAGKLNDSGLYAGGTTIINKFTVLDGFTVTAGNANGGINYKTGGGMLILQSDPAITNMIFTGNSAVSSGGGMEAIQSHSIIKNVAFSNNVAANGAGVDIVQYSPTLMDVTVNGNQATTSGGGVAIHQSNTVLTNVTINGNQAPNGGGLAISQGNPILTNVTISGNSVTSRGGGISNTQSNPTLTNVTISGNSAGSQGGGISNSSSNPVMRNIILWSNTAPTNPQMNNVISSPAVTYSIVQGGYSGTGNLDADPLLGSLKNNGGYTETMALGAGSPAIDAGDFDCPATDQRGVTRPQGSGCDIGAYELSNAVSYTVIFDASGGTGTMSNQVSNVSTALSLNTFTRIGYSFTGWNTQANDSGTSYANGANYPFTADVTLYAQWSALPNHAVTFNANGGMGSMSNQVTNVATALSLNTFTRTGYSFAGWNTQANGSGTSYANGASYPFTADATLYAQWSVLPNHTVTFNADGGVGSMSNQVTNVATALSLNTFTRTGYSFAGWNTQANGSGTSYANGASYPFTADVTLYAQWNDLPNYTFYVKWNAGGANNGSSWTDAYTDLQSALSAASSGDEIWVAAGTYKPTTSTDRTISFELKNGVAIYGGFAGTETLRTQRNPVTNVTVLSGDIGVAGNSSDNSYHVIVGSDTNNSVVLDGFTVTGGNADGSSINPQGRGGGMLNVGGDPTLSNIIFSNNSATFGGGMFNEGVDLGNNNWNGSDPILTNISFTNNSATEGGGMENMNHSSPTLMNVIFSGNTVTRSGGGMLNFESCSPTLTNVTFKENSAAAGGGMLNWMNNDPVLTNVTFANNEAIWIMGGGIGGGIGNYQSNPVLTSVTFSGNSATYSGGGIYNENNSNPVVRNTILWGNTALDGAQVYDATSTPVVSDSVVQDGYVSGTNVITADPKLGTLRDYGGFTETIPLLAGSPAIDAGDDANCPDTDQRGVTRPQGSHCDIGAYEFEPVPAKVDVTIGGDSQGNYTLGSGEEKRLSFNVSGGPVKVESLDPDPSKKIVTAIRLQSYANNTLYSFAETMGVPSGLLSYKYYFPSYNNIWAPLNSQIRFSNLDANPTTIRVTIGGNNVWEQQVLGGEEKRLSFDVSGGPVIIESLDPAKKIAAAIRLQSYANNTLYSFAETMGIPAEQVSNTYYFPSYNNIWAPLNSQLRIGNLDASDVTVRVTIGGDIVWEDVVPGLDEKRLSFNVSGGPVKVESLDPDPSKKIVTAIRLQSYVNNTLYSFAETMGVPSGLLSYKYYFPSYNNIWAPLNSQIRFSNLDANPTTIRVTIGGNNVWEQQVLGGEEKRLSFDVSGGPVIIESLDPAKKIAAAIRLQSYANNTLYSFAETMGIPAEWMSNTYYFPSYNNIWAPLNSQLRFGLP